MKSRISSLIIYSQKWKNSNHAKLLTKMLLNLLSNFYSKKDYKSVTNCKLALLNT